MGKFVTVKASNKKEALKQGKEKLRKLYNSKVDEELIEIKEKGIEKKFFGLKKIMIYEVSIRDDKGVEVSENEKNFLEKASDSINVDGEFNIKISNEGIFLKVSPAEGKGKNVSYLEIKKALVEKEIVEVDWQEVQNILSDKENSYKEIAPRKVELDRDASIDFEINEDKLKAFMTYTPALGGKELSWEDVENSLKDHNIIYGIKEDKIKKSIENREEVEKMLIAEGDEPLPGKDAYLEYHVEEKEESTGTKRDDGSVDFFNLGMITNVEPGQTLVTKIDSKQGTPGKNVTGEEILPPEPADVSLPRGKNVAEKDDHNLIAKIAGQVVFEGQRVNVLPVYEEKGDVDLSTGNIEFVGNVIIRGSIKEGFKVKAEGNVEVLGQVEAGNIEADGDVKVHKGFIGKNKAEITAGGNVNIKFVENAVIKAEGTITVTDAVMHSKLTAANNIDITAGKGFLVGGSAKARKKIEANIAGSHLATTTNLEVGLDPELKEKINTLEEEIKEIKNNLIKTKKALDIMEKIKEKQEKLSQEKEEMYLQLKNTNKRLESRLSKHEVSLAKLQSKMEVDNNGYIEMKRKVYPGVKIIVRNAQHNVHKEISGTRFIEKDGEICQAPLR